MLEEGNQPGGDRDELFGRDVHVIHPRRLDVDEIAFATAGDAIGGEVAPVIDRRVGLGHNKRLFAIGGQVIDVAGDAAFLDLAVRRLDEPEIIHASIRAH